MKPAPSQQSLSVYASEPTYREPPSLAEIAAGVVPLDTLPAAWWNWLWWEITRNNNWGLLDTTDIRNELLAVLTNAGDTPDASVTNQLLGAILAIVHRPPTTDGVSGDPIPGTVISSAGRSSCSVGSDGIITPNALSDWVSSSSVKSVIEATATAAENAVGAEETARKAVDVASVDTSISGNTLTTEVTSTDGTTHSDTASVITGISASVLNNILTITVNGVSTTVDLSSIVPVITTTVETTVNNTTGVLTTKVNNVSDTVDLTGLPIEHATGATYVRPKASSSTSVTQDGSGNLTCHTLTAS